MYPGKTEPMTKNTTHSSIGCNGMANNDDYHGLEMYKNHAKDSTTEGYMQPDPTTMECDHQWLGGSSMSGYVLGWRVPSWSFTRAASAGTVHVYCFHVRTAITKRLPIVPLKCLFVLFIMCLV